MQQAPPHRSRRIPTRQSKSVSTRSLDPGTDRNDGNEEDPCRRGILRNTSCRRYRERLRNSRQMNIFHGLMIILGVSIVMSILMLNGIEVAGTAGEMGIKATAALVSASAIEMDQAKAALWLGFKNLFGKRDDSIGHHHYHHRHHQEESDSHSYYCNQKMDVKGIFQEIGKQVLNQEQALTRLERTLDGDRKFDSIALLGPPGVGKSLMATTLSQHFPWPENVHAYSWSTYVPDEVRKFHMIRQFVDNLSDCGKNLLIIDNLSPCDYGIVPIYNQLLLEREGESNLANNQSVLVIYIFNLDTDHYWGQFELLQKLPDETTIIHFKPFGRDELIDCFKNELEIEKRFMGQKAMTSLMNEIQFDIYATGCKGLRELVLQHGIPNIN